MKLNWAERWVVNNPVRIIQQRMEVRWLRGTIPFNPDARVLEVGCGRGAGARLILEEFRPSSLCALDLDIEMLKKAKKYLSPEERKIISLYAGDITCLPFKAGSFKAVFGFGVLHHALDWRGALCEISRVLETGGAYFIEDLYPGLYQNIITRHILLHPTEDRFSSSDLRETMERVKMPIKNAIDCGSLGILGVAVKGV